MKKIIRPSFLFLASFFFLSGCALFDPLPSDVAAARKQVDIWVPEGTTEREAQRRMEQRDFKCQFYTDPATRKKYLTCHAHGSGLVYRTWIVHFTIEQEVVTETRVTTALTGP